MIGSVTSGTLVVSMDPRFVRQCSVHGGMTFALLIEVF